MFNRIIQSISHAFTNRRVISTEPNCRHRPEPEPVYTGSDTPEAIGQRDAIRPSRNYPKRQDGLNGRHNGGHEGREGRHFRDSILHNDGRLLREGRLQIGIAGFHDTAFEVAVMNRHDAPDTPAAIADLPCRVKMVVERNIADGLLLAQHMMGKRDFGRRGIILITSGDSANRRAAIENAAEAAAVQGIGIHVISVGPKDDDLTCGPRIGTKESLGYGSFRVVGDQDQLLASLHNAMAGLKPAFGMTGVNRAVILLDCSETMVEAYHGTTRIEMVITSLQEVLKATLIRSQPLRLASDLLSIPRPSRHPKPTS